MAKDAVGVSPGMMAVELGFTVERLAPAREAKKVMLTDTPDYTYKARVEKVIDGDTLRVLIIGGFDTRLRQKIRLRGLDCPEMDTPEGKRAKRFVERSLKDGEYIIIKTHKDRADKYDRYLADVFFPSSQKSLDSCAGRVLQGKKSVDSRFPGWVKSQKLSLRGSETTAAIYIMKLSSLISTKIIY